MCDAMREKEMKGDSDEEKIVTQYVLKNIVTEKKN